jgi:hypothetical protein
VPALEQALDDRRQLLIRTRLLTDKGGQVKGLGTLHVRPTAFYGQKQTPASSANDPIKNLSIH